MAKNKIGFKREKYYICLSCGDLKTETEILEEVGLGSCGMCYCEFDQGRILNTYKRINKEVWERLKQEKTDKLRMKMYFQYKTRRLTC